MSNALAIATVTATLQQTILGAVSHELSGTKVVTGLPTAPTDISSLATVNIYLYQVGANAGYRNNDLPTRSSTGKLLRQPAVGLDLYYLLTFYGDEQKLEPQRLLGTVVRTLHTYSVLSKDAIRATINQPLYSFLATSNLADAPIEQVKFTPLYANALGEGGVGSIWHTFFNHVPYSLSMAYQASLVVIEGDETINNPQPVQEPIITVNQI